MSKPSTERALALGSRAIPLLALLLGLGLTFGPMLERSSHAIPGHLGDTRLVHFSLEHAHRVLLGVEGHPEFWSPPIFYPARGTAAYTDTLLSLVPFYTPWRLFGASPQAAFQFWWAIVFGLNFAAFWVYLRRLFDLAPWSAAGGAYLFTFGSARLVDLGHPQMMPWFYCVAALYALHRVVQAFLDDGRPIAPWLAVLTVALVLQAYAAVYPLFFVLLGVALLAPLALVAQLWTPERQRHLAATPSRLLRRPDRRSAAALVVVALASLAVVPLARQYLAVQQAQGARSWTGVEPRMPRLSSWVLMGPSHRLYGELSEAKAQSRPGWPARSANHNNGLGFVTLGAVLLGLVLAGRHRGALLPLAVATGLLVAFSTVYPGGFTPWRWLFEHFPGAGAIRAVGRVGMVQLIPAGVAFGVLLERLGRHRRLRWGLPILVALVVIEQLHELPSIDGSAVYGRTTELAAAIPEDCSAFLLTPETPRQGRSVHEDAMWMALARGVPTVNGRYGNRPPGWRLTEISSREGLPAGEVDRRLHRWLKVRGVSQDAVCWLETRGDSLVRRPPPAPQPSGS